MKLTIPLALALTTAANADSRPRWKAMQLESPRVERHIVDDGVGSIRYSVTTKNHTGELIYTPQRDGRWVRVEKLNGKVRDVGFVEGLRWWR